MADILLVHGAWHGSWCWDDVAGALRDRGHGVLAIDLPGHDHPGDTRRIWNRIGQYVAAVGEAAASMDAPVIVGHSMGGYAVQRHLERNTARRGVLVASVPARGALPANLRTLRAHPALTLRAMLTADYHALVGSPELVRELFLSPDTPDDVVDRLAQRLQNESAVAINTMVLRPPRPQKVTTPVSVIAAEGDTIFTLDEQRALAAAYGTEAVVLEGGHDLMVDSSWPSLVDAIDSAIGSEAEPRSARRARCQPSAASRPALTMWSVEMPTMS
ncbi:MAG: alpha/beta hydrolase [Actinomycetota bacterium]